MGEGKVEILHTVTIALSQTKRKKKELHIDIGGEQEWKKIHKDMSNENE